MNLVELIEVLNHLPLGTIVSYQRAGLLKDEQGQLYDPLFDTVVVQREDRAVSIPVCFRGDPPDETVLAQAILDGLSQLENEEGQHNE